MKTDADILLSKLKSAESNDMSFLTKKQKKSKKNVFEVTEANLENIDEDSFAREFDKSVQKFTTDLRNITLHDPANFIHVEEEELNATPVGQTGDIDIDDAEQIRLVMELFNMNTVSKLRPCSIAQNNSYNLYPSFRLSKATSTSSPVKSPVQVLQRIKE